MVRIFRMEANRKTVAYVIAPDHVAACHSYMDAARQYPSRYPQSVDVFPVYKWEGTPSLPMSQCLIKESA